MIRAALVALLLTVTVCAADDYRDGTTNVFGLAIKCITIDTASTRISLGMRGVHAVACAESGHGEMRVVVLRRNGRLVCTGKGYVDPYNERCAVLDLCGNTAYRCLF